jgi:hypothetical protein
MASFPGGSPWAMAKDIASGVLLVTDRTFRAFDAPQLDKIAFELERHLRGARGEQPPLDDTAALQERNRRIQRLTSAATILRNARAVKRR